MTWQRANGRQAPSFVSPSHHLKIRFDSIRHDVMQPLPPYEICRTIIEVIALKMILHFILFSGHDGILQFKALHQYL